MSSSIIGDSANPPGDIDDDGTFEDINGDGSLTIEDPFTLAFNLHSASVKKQWTLFDFDGDGDLDFDDSSELFQSVKSVK